MGDNAVIFWPLRMDADDVLDFAVSCRLVLSQVQIFLPAPHHLYLIIEYALHFGKITALGA